MTEAIIEQFKTCTKCETQKSVYGFHRDRTRPDGLFPQCIECVIKDRHRYRATSKGREATRIANNKYIRSELGRAASRRISKTRRATEKGQQECRDYRARPEVKQRKRESNRAEKKTPQGKARERRYNLSSKYGMSIADYDAMVEAQDGKCAICLRPPSKRHLFVDHDHSTGKVRGLLCSLCNLILGRWKDSPETVERAKQYLLRHRQLTLISRDGKEIAA